MNKVIQPFKLTKVAANGLQSRVIFKKFFTLLSNSEYSLFSLGASGCVSLRISPAGVARRDAAGATAAATAGLGIATADAGLLRTPASSDSSADAREGWKVWQDTALHLISCSFAMTH